jgi:hypothetical protein
VISATLVRITLQPVRRGPRRDHCATPFRPNTDNAAAPSRVSFASGSGHGGGGAGKNPRAVGPIMVNKGKRGMSQLIDIFLEPSKAWAQLKERPTFLLPALVVALSTTLAATLYFLHVDPAWLAEYQVQAMAKDMSAGELAKMQEMMPGARTLAWITAATTLVFFAIVYAVTAVYYLLAGKVAGHAVDFKRGLALATWSSMPMVLAAIVSIIGIYTNSPQTSYESLQMLSLDPLFVQLPLDHDWSRLAKSFSLLNFWAWFLAALGWKTWFRTGWGQAVFVAVLPSLVIYGCMALFALL